MNEGRRHSGVDSASGWDHQEPSRPHPPRDARFGDLLTCGISTQLRQYVDGFDELITRGDPDFSTSGLLEPSIVRLGFLALLPRKDIPGAIGSISSTQHRRLLKRLSDYLVKS